MGTAASDRRKVISDFATMKIVAKTKYHWRRFCNYWRYDFKEMAFPSSLPDPPGTKKPKKLTWKDHVFVWKLASDIYIRSWKTHDIDIDEEFELAKDPSRKREEKKEEKKEQEPTMIEDIAVAAKAGSEHIRPALHRIYMTKASSYRDALKNFIQGYQEGLKESLDNTGNESADKKVDNATPADPTKTSKDPKSPHKDEQVL